MHVVHTQPHQRAGGDRPVAVPRVGRGGGGGQDGRKHVSKRSTHARSGMHMQQCSAVPSDHWYDTNVLSYKSLRGGGVWRPRQGPTLGCWAWGGRGLHVVPVAQGGGRLPRACMPVLVGGDGAATPAHFSTGGGGGGRRAPAACPCPGTNRGAMGVLRNRLPGGKVGVLVRGALLHAGFGHEATETGLAYAPVSQAHGHNHIVQCFACCIAA